jgi:NADH-quinone oxidoreductase subunit G
VENLAKVTINGREYMLPKGVILVDAAKTVGIDIPIFCYHPKMKPVGACRMCLVEIEKAPKLQTACTTPVADGMIVNTTSAKAIAGQSATIEFLLANHPLDCPVCDRGGECPLQDNTFGYGRGLSVFAEEKRHYVKPVPLSDKVLLDRERCIMCYRCVRFTKEIAGDETLTVLERGSWSQIGVLEGRTFDSPFSGNTIEICPVGALTSTQYRFKARPWDIKNHPSLCTQCSVGCNTTLTVRDNKIARVLSRENAAVDDGWLCDRGRFNYEFVASPERLTRPLIRRNGTLEPVSWSEAIALVRDRLQETLVKRGPGAIALLASSTGTNEEAYLLQKLARTVFGTNNVDHTFERHPTEPPLPFHAATGSIAGLERSNVIILADVNPIVEQPILDLRLKKAQGKGARLIIIGSEKIDLVDYATTWLKVKAEDVAEVARALNAVVAQEELAKTDFLEARVDGGNAALATAKSTNVDDVAARIGVGADTLRQIARSYAGAGNASVVYRRSASSDAAKAWVSLALLTGQIGRAGAGVYPLVRDANEQGAFDVGAIPHRLPGQRALDDASGRHQLADLWGREPPSAAGIAGADLFDAIASGSVSAVYLIGHDPVGNARQLETARASLERADFVVVQDTFLTETAKLATVVLPGAAFAEKPGTYTNLERRIQRQRLAIALPGEARADWQIVRDLGRALGGDFDYQDAADVTAEIALTVPIYAGMTASRVGSRGIQWPRRADGDAGTESLYADGDGNRFTLTSIGSQASQVGSEPA